ncbi:serine protease grass-like [Drosophila nasuta]|uniref:serine protease grass-like n=1 Tax=Drosophila nasuta TaxID=42062 RepID=UPI00295EC809|nr:serine protease grass-like [Drosophila nasuta]
MSRPWMAILNLKHNYKNEIYICGGTLINKRYVLTAAHCFDEKELFLLRLGEHNIIKKQDCDEDSCAPPFEDIGHERIFVHEKYSLETRHDDIALVKLSKDVEFKRSISPICLPTTKILQQKVNNIKDFHVTGWGKTKFSNYSNTLMEIIVNQKNRAKCNKSFPKYPVDSTQICAGADGKDACGGDSGGPLSQVVYFNGYQRFVQYGVVNFGFINCTGEHPGVYTNVGSYIRWIAYTIATK